MYLMGAFVAVAAGKDGKTVSEQVIAFTKQYQVSAANRRKMLRYFQELSTLSETVPAGDLFFRLSPSITQKLLLDVHGHWLLKLPFARALSHRCNGVLRPRASIDSDV